MSLGYGKNWDPAEHYKAEATAEEYDRRRFRSPAGRLYNALEKRLIRRAFAGLPPGTVVGDVPCGTGRLAEVLLAEGLSVSGIDISPAMLRVAQRRLARFGARFSTQVCDAKELQSSGIHFDAALCARVLMHFPLADQIRFLANVAAVTKGRVVFTQGIDTPYHRLRRRLKKALKHQSPAIYPLKPAEVVELIDAAGLREVRRFRLLPAVSEAVVIVTEQKQPA